MFPSNFQDILFAPIFGKPKKKHIDFKRGTERFFTLTIDRQEGGHSKVRVVGDPEYLDYKKVPAWI